MAHSVSFDMRDLTLESPVDEGVVHDSFSRLIEEQSQSLDKDDNGLEMQVLSEEDVSEEDLLEEDRDNVPYLVGSTWDRLEQERGPEHTDPLTGEQWSNATLKVLSSMPSRTIGRSRGAILSQYYSRTLQLRRRRQSRPSLRDYPHSSRPSIRGYGVEIDATDLGREECKKDKLVNNLQNLSVSDRTRVLKGMPLSLAEKSELRKLATSYKGAQMPYRGQIPCCSRLKYYIIIALRHTWYSWLSFLLSLQLWQVALKRVSGRFGTGVLSYFVFLRTLLLFNVFLVLITGFFLVIPQAVHPSRRTGPAVAFTGLELLTGGGYFTDSVMYYGYYANSTLNGSCQPTRNNSRDSNRTDCSPKDPGDAGGGFHLSYNMPLAYFFTIGMAFFITCIILVYSMSKSFGQSFRVDKPQGSLALKVFCSWDFKVMKKSSVKLQSENISTQLKELLSELSSPHERKSVLQRLARVSVHLLAWTMCVGSTAAVSFAVHYFSEYMHNDLKKRADLTTQSPLEKEASLLALPVVVSGINLLLPGFFNTVAWMEEYDSLSMHTHVAIFRNLMLKVSVLAVLCYHWLGRIASNPPGLNLECWENFVGQELYRFLLMDFIFTILDTFFGEFLWKLFSQKALKRKRKPVFDIARNVLELIYGQTLAWLGVLFAPLLPVVQVLKLLLLFYMKKASLMLNCQAPRKPWRASQMTTLFISLLCFPSFVGAAVCVTYTMWSIKPSGHCGPFQNLTTMFQSGKRWVQELADNHPKMAWLAWMHTYLVENPLFLFVAAGIFLVVIYFHTQVVDGQRKIICLLQEQIESEGEDKKFLIRRLQAIHEQRRPRPVQRPTPLGSERLDENV
ncbi:transmembrane channel-like protein 6b [Scleropages formosus]|uniref:Transmembrane channel-like protein n=1 Tax=Scleropages formosus TaxID=113540 RepID=A0A8C9SCL8_SCLFO|nr:transmembrane channel-like protein 6 [Scleropages formosus]XP_018600932.2 transmembrane channel-like protein 6 [Scleropages formosus]XP_018600933.2 transmembrane channel-like protein 6 [Scleropages formosus]XP_018600934.2 transmembrane channel-like protein 6 [Scleropages formosus]